MLDSQVTSSDQMRFQAKQFFTFIEEFSSIRSKVQTDYKKIGLHRELEEIRQKQLPGVYVCSTGVDVVLSVERPTLPSCPEPPSEIIEWVKPGWKDPKNLVAEYRKSRKVFLTSEEGDALPDDQRYDAEGNPKRKEVLFEDNTYRPIVWEDWIAQRNAWLATCRPLIEAFQLYTTLYDWKSVLDKEGFEKGCFLCNGFVRSEDGEIDSPLLFQQVFIEIDVENQPPVIQVRLPDEIKTRVASEILRQASDNFNFDILATVGKNIEDNGIDLFDNDKLREIFTEVASNLSSKCLWQDVLDVKGFNDTTKYIFFPQPILFLTKLPNGVKEAVRKIQELIDDGQPIPAPLRHLLRGYEEGEGVSSATDQEETPMERLATVGGESKDVLLALAANRDQLQIAKKVQTNDAVLVQGPPGTGKTHTIANLLGNLLADGQRVLVTSATDKALSVLRDKLPEVIQPLCVTLLDNRADSATEDLKRAVDGICSTIGRADYQIAVLERRDKEQTKEREGLLKELSEVRQQLFAIRDREGNKVPFEGESHTLSDWAKWVHDNESLGQVLPDSVSSATLTLSSQELEALYQTNAKLTLDDEKALSGWLPYPKALPDVDTVLAWLDEESEYQQTIVQSLVKETKRCDTTIFEMASSKIEIPNVSLPSFQFEASGFTKTCPAWIREAQISGMIVDDMGHTDWDRLISEAEAFIEEATQRRRSADSQDVLLPQASSLGLLQEASSWFIENAPNGQVSFFQKLFNKEKINDYQQLLSLVSIGGHAPQSRQDFEKLLAEAIWQEKRRHIETQWNQLIGDFEGPTLSSLGRHPEVEMPKFLKLLREALQWWSCVGKPMIARLKALGINTESLLRVNDTSSNPSWRDALWSTATTVLLPVAQYIKQTQEGQALEKRRQAMLATLTPPAGEAKPAAIVLSLQKAVVTDAHQYRSLLQEFERLNGLREVAHRRVALLEKLSESAPRWAESIRERKEGWTQSVVPHEVRNALRWRAISDMVQAYDDIDYNTLQVRSRQLSWKFRKVSSDLAATRAWKHLALRLDAQPNLLQSLRGWVATVAKIGKGTGKKAPRLQAQARKQAKDCQGTVPVWVMTTQRALTTLNPKEKFDVIIVDEASQSDLTALAILFMGTRVIVVGDDQQVSPMGIGISSDQVIGIQQQYLNDVPNPSIYDENSSLYDIIQTVSTPVRLREHFRCAKEIIDFSSQLSYDGEIRPLRDMSECPIRPHVVSYQVSGKRTEKDTNPIEAQAIVALVKSCIEQPEYKDKTFGVISMVSGKGPAQVECIDQLLKKVISPQELEKRRIVVGTSANFQGDERDVIFLSLVQSRQELDKPIRKEGYGTGGSTKKRYNVAVSRARDQLWVVHSFDPDTDLVGDDIRRQLLMHIRDPYRSELKRKNVIAKTESPFEKEVANKLVSLGYQIDPQHQVGSYRLDFVVRDGDHAVALECDGEAYHSTPEQITHDMERQAILERSGWVFIRLRGSEYYRDPERAIARLCEALHDHNIDPSSEKVEAVADQGELLERVKERASKLLNDRDLFDEIVGMDEEVYADLPVDVAMSASITDPSNQEHAVAEKSTDATISASLSRSEAVSEKTLSTVKATAQMTEKSKPKTWVQKTEVNHSLFDTDELPFLTPVAEATSGDQPHPEPSTQTRKPHAISKQAVTEEKNGAKKSLKKVEIAPSQESHWASLTTVDDYYWDDLTASQQKTILEQDRYMFECFKQHGWKVFDKRHAKNGCLWVMAGEKEFKGVGRQLHEKFGLYFKYSSKPSAARGGLPGWWLVNKTLNRGK